jgi:GNAT superfamily N-acetyltransferase
LELVEVDHGSDAYRDVVALRRRVLRAPLGLDFTAEQLAEERADIHIAAYLDGVLAGCVVLTEAGRGSLRLRQMAVDPHQQGRGTGARILAFAERRAAERGHGAIVLHARESAVGFYERAGYVATGEVFLEVTIPHRVMVKRLSAAGVSAPDVSEPPSGR